MSGSAVQIGLGGRAQVCCVHDREKRLVITERQVAELGLEMGHVYDPKRHRLYRCACCENLFVSFGDEPTYCYQCRRSPIHTPAAPLPEPSGALT